MKKLILLLSIVIICYACKKQTIEPNQVESECEAVELKFTTQDMIEAVNYGFKYALESQHNNEFVPNGNILQWIMYKRNLLEIPKEFEIFKNR